MTAEKSDKQEKRNYMKLFGKELTFGKVVDGSRHVYLDVNMNLEGLIAFVLTAIFFFIMGMAV